MWNVLHPMKPASNWSYWIRILWYKPILLIQWEECLFKEINWKICKHTRIMNINFALACEQTIKHSLKWKFHHFDKIFITSCTILTNFGTASDQNFTKMTIFLFQCWGRDKMIAILQTTLSNSFSSNYFGAKSLKVVSRGQLTMSAPLSERMMA